MGKAKKKKPAKRKPRKKSGMQVVDKAGKRKKPKKRSGFLKNPNDSIKSAFMAAGVVRAASGAVAFAAKVNNKGEALPKVKAIVPGLITAASYGGVIPPEYMFAGAMATTDAVVDTTDWLKKLFDFEWLNDMIKPKSGMTIREIPQRMYQIPARSGLAESVPYRTGGMTDIMDERNGANYVR